MNKRHYEHTLPNIRGSLSNTYTTTYRKHLQANGLTGSAYGNMPALQQGYLPVLFLLSGTLISLLFRTFTLIVKIIIALTVMGMLV